MPPPLPPRSEDDSSIYANYPAARNSAPESRSSVRRNVPATRTSAPESSDIYANTSVSSENIYHNAGPGRVPPPRPPRPDTDSSIYANYPATRTSAPESRSSVRRNVPATRTSAPESSDTTATSQNVYDTVEYDTVASPSRKTRRKSSANTTDYEEPVSILHSQSTMEDKEPVIAYDVFFDGQKVFGLDDETFHDFVKFKDLAMIMFYDPLDPRTDTPKANFKKAARRHGSDRFAAVDCQRYPDLCASLDIDKMPMLKVYSKGNAYGTIREMSQFDDTAMIQHLDTLYGVIDTTKRKSISPSLPDVPKSKCTLAKIFGFKK